MYIRRKDLETFGYTEDCVACRIIQSGRYRSGVNHSEFCRQRIVEALGRSREGRLRLEEADRGSEPWKMQARCS